MARRAAAAERLAVRGSVRRPDVLRRRSSPPWAWARRRGDIRAGVLLVLADRPMHGYEVMTELAERSGGVWRPSPGSVYPTLQQLEDEDLVRSEEVEHKRIFRLTEAGTAEAEQVAARRAPWSTVTDGLTDEQRTLHQAALQLARRSCRSRRRAHPSRSARRRCCWTTRASRCTACWPRTHHRRPDRRAEAAPRDAGLRCSHD